MEHIDKEDKMKHYKTVNGIVGRIKEEGGAKSNAFWELKRKLSKKKRESGHAIIDEDGVRHDSIEAIKAQHVGHYKKLLTSDTVGEDNAVNRVISGLNLIAKSTETEEVTIEQVNDVVAKLKKRKAKDKSGWKNEYAMYGGEEMIESLRKICQAVTDQMEGPEQWDEMTIKSTHKKGMRMLMKNKRGLFLTNIIGKILERVVKKRNKEDFKKGLSPNQTCGISTIDNPLVVLAIIERNNYLNKTTYITFADVQKCFDKLWLDDGIKDIWMCGVNARDAVTIKNLNRRAKITVDTPVGMTEEFVVENIVKQGTVYAVDICGAVMDSVNKIGYPVIATYGPDLVINALVYMDDIVSAGSSQTSNNTIQSCSMMEKRKQITFNTEPGKSATMIVNKKKKNNCITEQVKKGEFVEVEEYKLLGVWLDGTGKYMMNIQ